MKNELKLHFDDGEKKTNCARQSIQIDKIRDDGEKKRKNVKIYAVFQTNPNVKVLFMVI